MLLSEEDAMNKLNPYVVFDFSLPGSVRQTPEFADHGKEVNGTEDVERRLSSICDVAMTSGDRTIDFCKGGREPACAMGRPVYPRVRIDTCEGIAEYKPPRSGSKSKSTDPSRWLPLVLLVLVMLFIFRLMK